MAVNPLLSTPLDITSVFMQGKSITEWRLKRGWSLEVTAEALGFGVDELRYLEAKNSLSSLEERKFKLLSIGVDLLPLPPTLLDRINNDKRIALISWRTRLGLTQQAAARILGVKAGRTVSGYETGSYIIPDKVMLLAHTFESIDDK
jgi:transcriptional regulator with XRE-family HTH domain